MATSITSEIKKKRDLNFLKVLLFSGLLSGFISFNATAACTVTGVSGSGFIYADFCAPAYTSLYYEFTFGTTAPPLPTYRVIFFWGDGTPNNTAFYPVQSKLVGALTVYYIRAERDHTFPAGGNCEYNVNMILVDNGFQCNDSRQIQIVSNWHQDNVASAMGSVAMNPLQKDVCEGLPLVDFQFNDVTNFACNLQDFPLAQKANHTPRQQQYVYGTNPVAGKGIPNLFIKAGTAQTLVRLTENDGSSVANSWTVDPTTGGAVAPYVTVSGYFEGPVVTVPVDAATGSYSLDNTYPILFDGVGTVFQDQFQVTLRNWNICNSIIPNTATSLIYIIDGPLADAGSDAAICSNSTFNMNGAVVDATSALWTTTGNGTFASATSPDNAVYTPGAADVAAGYVDLVLHAYAGGMCPEHTDIMRLTLDPIPSLPVVSIDAGSNNFCDDNSQSITLISTLSPNGSYLWRRNSISTGITTQTIVRNDYTQSGNYTATVYGTTANVCPRESNPFTLTIFQMATTTNPGNATVCQGSNTSFSITAGGAASNIRWQRRIGAGAWVDITAGNVPNDGCTYSNYTTNTLNIANAAAGMDTYQYRAQLTTTAGSCITNSNGAILTVNPTASITTQPSNATVCELSNTSFSVVASVTGPSTITGYQWQRRPNAGGYANIGAGTDGGIYTNYNSATLNISNTPALIGYTYQVVITTTGGCTVISAVGTLTVNQLADITAHPANSAICAGVNTSFTVTDDGNPNVTGRQWQRWDGSVWTNITAATTPNDGCTYSNWTSGTLGLAGVPAGMNTFQYRCILTTTGPCTITSNAGLLTVHTIPIDRTVAAADSWLCYNTGTDINLTASESSIVYQLRIGVTNVGGTQTGTGANLAFPTGNLTSTSIFNINAGKTTTIGPSTLTCYLQMTNTPTVNVNPNLTITNLTHPDICFDGTIDLPSATPGGGSGTYTYAWTGTGGYTNTVQNPASFIPGTTGAHSYTVTVTDEGFRTTSVDNTICTIADAIPFTVNPLPTIGMSVSDPTICAGQTATITLANSVSGTNYQLRLDSDDSNIGPAVPGTGVNITFIVTPAATTTYNVMATIVATGCDSEVTDKSTVTVNPLPAIGMTVSDPSICFSFPANISLANSVVGTNYQLRLDSDDSNVGAPVAGTGIAITFNVSPVATTTYNVLATIVASGCQAEVTDKSTVTVNPAPPGPAGAITGLTNVCYGQSGVVYSIAAVANATNYVWSVPAGVSIVSGQGTVTLTVDFAAGAASPRIIQVYPENGCGSGGTSQTSVSIYSQLAGGTIANDQTICYGGDVAAFTSGGPATGGAGTFTYTWQYTTNMAAVAGDGNWTNIPLSNNAVWDYGTLTTTTRFIRRAVEGTCITPVYSNILLITVRPALDGGTIGSNQTICYGSDVVAFTNLVAPSGGDNTFTYTWQFTTNMTAVAGDGNWTDIGSSNTLGYDYGTLTLQTRFVRKATDISCSSPVYSNMITVNINPLPVTSAISGDAVICETATNKVYQVVNTSGSSYAWTLPGSLTLESPQGLYFIIVDAFSVSAPGDKITVVETFSSTTGCVGLPVDLPITVSPVITGVLVAGPTAVCKGDAGITYSVPDNVGSTYSWIVPAGAAITSADPTEHQIEVTFNMATSGSVSVVETSGSLCTTVHTAINVIVRALPTAYNLTAPLAYCASETGVVITLSNSETGVNYQLYNSLGPVGASSPGTTGSALTWNDNPAEIYYVIATRTTVDPPRPVTNCQATMNGTVSITINNIVPGSIGTAQTICEGDFPIAFTNVASGTGGGTITYQWQISSDDVTYTDIPGATSAVYSSGVLNADVWFKRIAISTMGTSICQDESNSLKVTVNNLTAGSITANQTICDGSSPVAFVSVPPTYDGTLTYQWKDSPDGITFTDISGAESETYAPGVLTQDTWYKRFVTSTLTGKACTKETNAVKVTVINFAPGSISIDQTICEGTAPAPFTSSAPSGDGTFTYQWQNSPDNSTWSDIVPATAANYSAPALVNDTYYRRMVISTLGGVPCPLPTNSVLVTVNNFIPGSIIGDQTICEGATPAPFTSVTPTGDGTSYSYQWQVSIVGPASGFSTITGVITEDYAPGALTQNSWYKRLVTSTLNTNTCTEVTNVIEVTVNNITVGSVSAAQTICDGDTPAMLTSAGISVDGTLDLQWQRSSDDITWTDIGGETGATYTPGALASDTWYRLEVTSTQNAIPCIKETGSIKITVNNLNPGSIGTDETICEGTAPAALTSVSPAGDGTVTYKWYSSPDDITYSLIGGAVIETYSPGILNADMWYYREVTSTLNAKACIEVTNEVAITVNNMTPGVIGSDQSICEGDIPAAFTIVTPHTVDGIVSYKWQESVNGIAYTDIPGAISSTFTSVALTDDTWFRRSVTSTLPGKACTEETNAVKVTVVNFAPGAIGSDQTICESTAPATFTSVAASGDGTFTYLWQSSPDNITWSDIGTATNATYTSPALTTDTYFRRKVTSTVNILCIEYTNSILVTVNNLDPGSISAAQTICENTAPLAFSSGAPTADGAITYQWQSSLDGTSYVNITGAIAATYAAGVLTQDTWYKRLVTSTLNGNVCTEPTNVVIVTVNNFDPGSISAAQTICENGTPVAFSGVAASGDLTSAAYQWYNSIDGSIYNSILGATLDTYAPGPLTQDTWYKREVTATLNGVDCTEETVPVKITVNNFDPGSISAAQTICEGAAPAPFAGVSPSGDGTFTYQWQNSIDGITFGNILGAVGETYNAGILMADTWYKRLVTSTLSGNVCTEETNVIKVTVINFIPGSIAAVQTVCEGVAALALTSVPPSGDIGAVYTYQWKSSPDGIVFTDINLETNETYSPGILTQDTWYKRAVIATLAGNSCTMETNAVRLTVINFAPGSISSDQTICEGAVPATFTSVAPSGDGAFTYQWQDSPDGITFTNIVLSANSDTYTSVALTTDTWFRRGVTSTLNATLCTEYTNAVKVTINSLIPGTISASQTICENSAPMQFTSTVSSGDGVLTYQWQSSLVGSGAGFSNITGAILDTYTAGILSQDTWYRLLVTSTLNGVLCTEITNEVAVTVVNFTAGTISVSQAVCEGAIPAPFAGVSPTGEGVFTYQWQSSLDGISFADIAGEISLGYTPPALTVDTWYKRVDISTVNLVPCTKESNVIKVTVNNIIPGTIATDQTICDGSTPVGFTSVTPTADGIITYQWQSSLTSIGPWADLPGVISETYNSSFLTQDTWFKRKVISTVGLNSCTEETNVIQITVNNFVPGSIAGNETICEGLAPTAFTGVLPTGDIGAVFTYQWRSSLDGVNYVDISGATSDTYTAGALTQDTWYKRIVISTLNTIPCTKETNSIKVTVNNVQGGTIISDQTICDGSDPVTFISIVNGSGDGVFTFQWQVSTDGIVFSDILGANSPNYDAPALTSDTWYKRITKSVLNGVECSKETNVVKITINEVTGGTITLAQTICYGTTPAPFTSTDDGTGTGTVTYQWQQSDNNITYINISGANSTDYAPGALLSEKYYKRIIISIKDGIVCTSESNVIKITVNPLPLAMLTGGETICPAQTSNLVVTMPVGTGPFTVDIENYPGVTIAGYVSGTNIPVTPAVTTTYKLLRVRDTNGCEVLSPSANLNGMATVVVSTPPSIATFIPSPAVCEFSLATFKVTANGTSPTYQWFVNEGTGFIPASDLGGVYFGSATQTLQIFNSVRSMNGYIYHVVVSGCGTDVTSADATFTVNTAPEFTGHPSDSTVCMGNNAIMGADADGTSVTWQWYVNKGSGFVPVIPDANFSGETTDTLTITNAQVSFNNWVFRAKATGICGVPSFTNFGRLSVINPPSVGLQPTAKVICENGSTSFLGNGSGYTLLKWQKSTDAGATWSNIDDDALYVGSATNQLSILSAPVTLSGNLYRLGLIGTCATTNTNTVSLTVNPNPVVSFAADVNACGGVSLVLNGNPAAGTAPYTQHRWTGDVGPLSSYTVQSPTFNSQISGSYTLNYKVTDSKGCTANDDLVVIVDSPSADFAQDIDNGCTPLSVVFTKDMTGITKFWWDFNDGSPVDSVTTGPVHKFTNTNTSSIEYRTVKLTVRSPGGCLDVFTSMITVYPTIDATFTGSTDTICSGNPVVFASLPGGSKYFWEYGDGTSAYGTNAASHLYTNFTAVPVVLEAKLTTTSFYNCSDVKKMSVTVMPVPLPQFTALPPTQVYLEAGNPVVFNNETNAGSWTWLWKFGDGATASTQSPSHTYTSLGDFTVTLVVNNASCSDSIKHKVSVLPQAPVAGFDNIPSGCEPLSVTINNTSTNTNIPGTTYRWDFGDGSISTAKNPAYTWFDPGTYRVELTVTGPGGTSIYSQVVNAYPSPKAYFEVTPLYVFVNDEKIRGFNLSTGADSYLWDFGDGDTSKLKEPFHKYMEPGVFDITLFAYSDNGCFDKYILSPGVTVEPAGEIRFSTVFTPNKDGPQDVDELPTGGTEIDQFFFPPIREKVLSYKLQIFNRLGVLIFESRDINKPWNGYYKGSLCSQGVYIWYVEGKYANGQPFKKVGDVTLLH